MNRSLIGNRKYANVTFLESSRTTARSNAALMSPWSFFVFKTKKDNKESFPVYSEKVFDNIRNGKALSFSGWWSPLERNCVNNNDNDVGDNEVLEFHYQI